MTFNGNKIQQLFYTASNCLLLFPPYETNAHLLWLKQAALKRYIKMKGNAPERLVSGSDDFTMFLWEPAVSKHHKTRMTGHQQVEIICCVFIFISSKVKLIFLGTSVRLVTWN